MESCELESSSWASPRPSVPSSTSSSRPWFKVLIVRAKASSELGDRRRHGEVQPGVSHASLVAILQAPKIVHTTSQAAITATAMAVDSGTKYDESRSPAGPFTIP